MNQQRQNSETENLRQLREEQRIREKELRQERRILEKEQREQNQIEFINSEWIDAVRNMCPIRILEDAMDLAHYSGPGHASFSTDPDVTAATFEDKCRHCLEKGIETLDLCYVNETTLFGAFVNELKNEVGSALKVDTEEDPMTPWLKIKMEMLHHALSTMENNPYPGCKTTEKEWESEMQEFIARKQFDEEIAGSDTDPADEDDEDWEDS